MSYPWLENISAGLLQEVVTERLGHAYVLSGAEGIGKTIFFHGFAKKLLCKSKTIADAPCDACLSCSTFASDTNPDFLNIQPVDVGKNIKVEQIRDITRFYSYKAHYGGQKIVLISPATKMNLNSANALLKILEEPPEGALILLVATSVGRLLPTIRSRCRNLKVSQPNWDVVLKWLRDKHGITLSSSEEISISLHGGPLAVLDCLNSKDEKASLFDTLLNDIVSLLESESHAIELAKQYTNADIGNYLNTLEDIINVSLLAKHRQHESNRRLCNKSLRQINYLSQKFNSIKMFEILDLVKTSRELLRKSQGVRGQDLIEDTFIFFRTCVKYATR